MKLSIIIPAYNVSPYLRACLESIFAAATKLVGVRGQGIPRAQRAPKEALCGVSGVSVEVICVDNGSTDGSGEILDQYANNLLNSLNPLNSLNLRILHQPNAGVGAARNAGLEVATGDWVLFADADDAYLPETLVYLAKAVQEVDADVFHFGYCEVGDQLTPVDFIEQPLRRYDLTSPTEARTAYAQAGMLMVWNVCARRSVIGDLRFETDMPIAEDCLFEQQLFFRASSFAVTSTVLYKYYQRPGSAIRTPTARGVASAIRSVLKQNEAFESWPMREPAVWLYRKKVRTTYCGQTYERLCALSTIDRQEIWSLYVEVGCQVTRRLPMEHCAFKSKCWLFIVLLVYFPYRLKVGLLRLFSR